MIPLAEIEAAARIVYQVMPPTPQYTYPLLNSRLGGEVWVKHENHTPIGAFKVRGGLVLLDALRRTRPDIPGIVSATRGNHGQSLAFAARRMGARCVLVVPHGNSSDKNRAMTALGAELVEHGHDFDSAKSFAKHLAQDRGMEFIESFRPELVAGVSTYALELFRAAPALDAVYVPIGNGSGICGLISARDALNLKTKIIGVVSEGADAYAQSFAARRVVPTDRADTFADGIATRIPVPASLDVILRGAEKIVTVADREIAEAVRWYFDDTHNVAEGAGAAPLAALAKDATRRDHHRAGVILSGGNIDRDSFLHVLQEAEA
jgi:threonine dehydratase